MTSLDYIFHPRSIAVAGVTTTNQRNPATQLFLRSLVEFPFPGPLYAVNPRGGEIMGRHIYPSLKDIPGEVDHVIAAIPIQHTLDLMRNCAAKGVKSVHFFTAGFSEMDEAGKKTERELIAIARQSGVRIIGPNCMGMYCPEAGVTYCPGFPKESGSVAFLGQSGGHTTNFIHIADVMGLRFSKVVSYGNANDLNESDYLEYCTKDDKTKIIGMYVEGIKDGPRFVRTLKNASARKPVILIKGGRTGAGTRAVQSHTGNLAGNDRLWDTIYRQTGALPAASLEEMLGIVMMFQYLPRMSGLRAGIVGFGGGASVLSADEAENAGLVVPELPGEVQRQLQKFSFFSSRAGSNFNNPVDSPLAVVDPKVFRQMVEVVAACTEIDFIIAPIQADFTLLLMEGEEVLLHMGEAIADLSKTLPKPVIPVLPSPLPVVTSSVNPRTAMVLRASNLPICNSVYSAAKTIRLAAQYQAGSKLEFPIK